MSQNTILVEVDLNDAIATRDALKVDAALEESLLTDGSVLRFFKTLDLEIANAQEGQA